MRKIAIGSAGWAIPRQHRKLFQIGDSVLSRYASLFNCVEINSSFYRPHQRSTYERWASVVPPAFRFSAKFPRSISHDARLQQIGHLLDSFLGEVEGLGDKLGCLLLQLPPSFAFNARALSTFSRMVRRRSHARLCCEPRHPSWFAPDADSLLRKHSIARVASDPAIVPAAMQPGGDRSWTYWRWHGSPQMYYSDYSLQTLAELAKTVDNASGQSEAWIIFDNTALGHATANAAYLRTLIASPDERLLL
ncbi:MAG TPA: DUF72 domain-containing protein [Rhodanobacteraceae bacterium]|nr:DUF72 domain-containing protein [Rhodanobacteraceae bacterium]